MNKNGMKCVIYVRVSTEMQVDGYSLDGQKSILNKYADREGMSVLKTYEDAGKSGKSIEGRPAFKNMLSDIENGLQVDYILVYKLSRFGRNAADILNSLEFIQDFDVNLISVEEGLDSGQTTGKLLISIMSTMAEMERENIIEQTMNGRREKARQGGWNGGHAPYGYNLINGNLVINSETAEIIKLIFNMFTEKNMGYGRICNELNLRGIKKVPTCTNSLDYWNKDTIRQIIINPVYFGKIAYGRKIREKIKGQRNLFKRVDNNDYILVDGKHEAIISEETWLKAQEIKKNKGEPAIAGRKRIHFLSGILKCPKCGGSMYASKYSYTTNEYEYWEHWYYECSFHKSYRKNPCDNKMKLQKPKIEPYVVYAIKQIIKNMDFIQYVKKYIANKFDNIGLESTKKDYEKKLKQVKENKSSIEQQLDNMPLDVKHRERKIEDLNKRLDDLYDIIDELETNINSINVKLASSGYGKVTEEKIIKSLEMFDKLFDNMTDEEKKDAIRGIVSSVTLLEKPHGNNYIKSMHFKFSLDKGNSLDYELDGSIFDDISDLSIDYKENTYLEIKATNSTPKPEIKAKTYDYIKSKTVTYPMIVNYVKEKYNIKISSNNIAEIKRKNGVGTQRTINKILKYTCSPEKAEAIEDALRYYKII